MQALVARARSRVRRGSSPMLARQYARAAMLVGTAPAARNARRAMLKGIIHPIGSAVECAVMVPSRTTVELIASSVEQGRPAPTEHARNVRRGHRHPKTDRPAVTAPTTKLASVEPVKCARLGSSRTLITPPAKRARRGAPVLMARMPRVPQASFRPTASSVKHVCRLGSCKHQRASAMHARPDQGPTTISRTV